MRTATAHRRRTKTAHRLESVDVLAFSAGSERAGVEADRLRSPGSAEGPRVPPRAGTPNARSARQTQLERCAGTCVRFARTREPASGLEAPVRCATTGSRWARARLRALCAVRAPGCTARSRTLYLLDAALDVRRASASSRWAARAEACARVRKARNVLTSPRRPFARDWIGNRASVERALPADPRTRRSRQSRCKRATERGWAKPSKFRASETELCGLRLARAATPSGDPTLRV
jgi:hypothetical protein